MFGFKNHLNLPATLFFGVFAFAISSTGFALPPDPGNTCGGNGQCSTEAYEWEYYNQEVVDLQDERDYVLQEAQLCEDTCEGSCSECDQVWATLNQIEADLWFMNELRNEAQDAYAACTTRCNPY